MVWKLNSNWTAGRGGSPGWWLHTRNGESEAPALRTRDLSENGYFSTGTSDQIQAGRLIFSDGRGTIQSLCPHHLKQPCLPVWRCGTKLSSQRATYLLSPSILSCTWTSDGNKHPGRCSLPLDWFNHLNNSTMCTNRLLLALETVTATDLLPLPTEPFIGWNSCPDWNRSIISDF